jgi:catechol 2,3-dioxygenase-like lactoylglutathione lyase family enzyme
MNHCVHHIGLCTNNPEELIRFYTDKLGFIDVGTKTVGRELMEKIFGIPADCIMTKLRRESALIEIFTSKNVRFSDAVKSARGLNHWGFEVKDKESFAAGLKKRGVEVTRLEGSGNKILLFIRDPDGNLIELYEEAFG